MPGQDDNEPTSDPQDNTPVEPIEIPTFPDNDWVKGDYTGVRDSFPSWRRDDKE